MESIVGTLSWPTLTLTGTLFTVVMLVLRGRLVPSSQLEALRSDYKDQITHLREDVSSWQSSYLAEVKSSQALHTQLQHLLDYIRSVEISLKIHK